MKVLLQIFENGIFDYFLIKTLDIYNRTNQLLSAENTFQIIIVTSAVFAILFHKEKNTFKVRHLKKYILLLMHLLLVFKPQQINENISLHFNKALFFLLAFFYLNIKLKK